MKKGKQRNVMKRRQAKKGQTAAMRKKVAKSRTRAAAVQRQDALLPDEIPVYAHAHGKLSAAVLEYADPLIEAAEGNDELHKAISMGVLFWNLSLSPKTEASEKVQDLIAIEMDSADDRFDQGLHAIFEMMYHRRHSLFADDRRIVLNYDITITDNSYHLNVASVVPAKDVELQHG